MRSPPPGFGPNTLYDLLRFQVHIENDHVRLPRLEDRHCLRWRGGHLGSVGPVIERQPDQLDDGHIVVQQEHADGTSRRPTARCFWNGSSRRARHSTILRSMHAGTQA